MEPTFRFCPACGDRLPAPPPPRDAAGPPLQQAPSPAAAAGGVRSEPWPGLSSPAARTPPRPPCAAARRGSSSPRKARPGPAEPLPDGEELRDRGAGRWRLRRLLEQGGCGLLYEGAGPGGAPRRGGGGEGGGMTRPRGLRTVRAGVGTERFTLPCVSAESGRGCAAAAPRPSGPHLCVAGAVGADHASVRGSACLGQTGTRSGAGLLPWAVVGFRGRHFSHILCCLSWELLRRSFSPSEALPDVWL